MENSTMNNNNHDIDEKVEVNIQGEIEDLRISDGDLQSERFNDNVTPTKNVQQTKSTTKTTKHFPYKFIPLLMGGNGRTHVPTKASASLLDEVGGVTKLQQMTESFYEKAFADATLDKFIRSREDPHGRRFATWIHQKLGGDGNLWDVDRQHRSRVPAVVAGGHHVWVNDRSSAHVAAWHSPKRPENEVGRHFKLDECRVWMRLHFWALRESKLSQVSPSFVDYYVRFIGHFVSVYESTAPAFARDSFRWSESEENIKRYLKNGRVMKDVLGLKLKKALKQIPNSEAEDTDWPYIDEGRGYSSVV